MTDGDSGGAGASELLCRVRGLAAGRCLAALHANQCFIEIGACSKTCKSLIGINQHLQNGIPFLFLSR